MGGHLLAGSELLTIISGLTGMVIVLLGLRRRQVAPAIEVLRREHALTIEPIELNKR
jgi:hypothetical protein